MRFSPSHDEGSARVFVPTVIQALNPQPLVTPGDLLIHLVM
jgi:hypothetical protein